MILRMVNIMILKKNHLTNLYCNKRTWRKVSKKIMEVWVGL